MRHGWRRPGGSRINWRDADLLSRRRVGRSRESDRRRLGAEVLDIKLQHAARARSASPGRRLTPTARRRTSGNINLAAETSAAAPARSAPTHGHIQWTARSRSRTCRRDASILRARGGRAPTRHARRLTADQHQRSGRRRRDDRAAAGRDDQRGPSPSRRLKECFDDRSECEEVRSWCLFN